MTNQPSIGFRLVADTFNQSINPPRNYVGFAEGQ